MNADKNLNNALSTSKSRYFILGISFLYLISNIIVTIVSQDRLSRDISIIPGGYRILTGGFLLSIILNCSITAYIYAAGIRINAFKVLKIYIVPIFLYFVVGFAHGFYSRFLLDMSSFTKGYLWINTGVLSILFIWVSYNFGKNRRRSLKNLVRESSQG